MSPYLIGYEHGRYYVYILVPSVAGGLREHEVIVDKTYDNLWQAVSLINTLNGGKI